ncbi:MAG: lysophospholipid acyltransferase family protein [SAR324 cluster bacterium]
MSEIRPEYVQLWPRKRRWLKPVRRWLQYWLARGILAVAGRLSVRTLQRLGRLVGLLVYRYAKSDRAVCEHQLRQALPDLSDAERGRIARECFGNMGTSAMEVLSLPRLSREGERWVALEQGEVLREAFAQGKGLILVTCHSGNWELMNIVVNRLRIPTLGVARPLHNRRLNELLLEARRSPYLEIMQRGDKNAPRQLLAALKMRKALFLPIDLDTDTQSVYVDFFGVPARTPRVAASLALRMNVPIVAVLDRRIADGTHIMRFDAIPVSQAIRSDVEPERALTQAMTAKIEAHVRAWPEQWAWIHRRWLHPPQ